MLDISEAKLDDARVNELIDVMFNESGVSDQNRMSYEDFRKVFELPEYKSTLQAASLAGGWFYTEARSPKSIIVIVN